MKHLNLKIGNLIKLFILSFILSTSSCDRSPLTFLPAQIVNTERTKLIGIFVDSMSTIKNPDGKSWLSAFPSINDAVKVANGANIYVAAGTYLDPNIELIDKKNVNIVGGYKSGARFVDDPKGKVIFKGDNRPLLRINGAAENIYISNIKFEGVSGASAVVIQGSELASIKNVNFYDCTFANNSNNPENAGRGAGIYIKHAIDIKLRDANFYHNQAKLGGGLYAENVEKLSVSGGVWATNMAHVGGGIFLGSVKNSEMINVIFFDNRGLNESESITAAQGGSGVAIYYSENLTLSALSFKDNKLNSAIGTLYIVSSSYIFLNFGEKISTRNEAAVGSVISVANSEHISIKGGYFLDNKARTLGGVLSINGSNDISISGSTFANNEALLGGALHILDNGNLIIEKSIFKKNKARNGGAILSKNISSPIIFKEAIFLSNKARYFGGALALDAKTSPTATPKYIIDSGTKFIKNIAELNFGGGAIAMAVPEAIPAVKQLLLNNRGTDYENNRSGGLEGKIVRVAPQAVDRLVENEPTLPGTVYDYIDIGSTAIGTSDAFKY